MTWDESDVRRFDWLERMEEGPETTQKQIDQISWLQMELYGDSRYRRKDAPFDRYFRLWISDLERELADRDGPLVPTPEQVIDLVRHAISEGLITISLEDAQLALDHWGFSWDISSLDLASAREV